MDNYIACMVLHATGDAIGFKNGEWEFNFFKQTSYNTVLELLYDFIDIGGINHINTKNWKISDDTIMHIAVANSLLKIKPNDDINKIMNYFKDEFIISYNILFQETELRFPGITLMNNLEKLKNGLDWDKLDYNFMSGGSGASMRNCCIGLAYHKESDLNKLISISIESSRMTHNSVIGYLGGFVSALFTSYAIQKISIKLWCIKLLDLFNSNIIGNYINSTGRGYPEFINDSHIYINKWYRYVQDKFDDNGEPIKRRSTKNLVYRGEYYHKYFGLVKDEMANKLVAQTNDLPGAGGDDSVIIAYDCLLDSDGKWEKFVIYSMLHIGDTDTTGSIGGGWWGAFYGFNDVPKINYQNLESIDLLTSLGKNIFNKYN